MRLTIGLAVSAIIVAACAIVEAEAPVVVSGTLVDGTGQPAPGVLIGLDVFDDRDLQPGQARNSVLHVETTSGADGRFEFRFGPTEELRRLVGRNSGFVNFTLGAFQAKRNLFWAWNFQREMGLDGWLDETTPVRLVAIEGGP
jgi:hypothetical protein